MPMNSVPLALTMCLRRTSATVAKQWNARTDRIASAARTCPERQMPSSNTVLARKSQSEINARYSVLAFPRIRCEYESPLFGKVEHSTQGLDHQRAMNRKWSNIHNSTVFPFHWRDITWPCLSGRYTMAVHMPVRDMKDAAAFITLVDRERP